MPALNLRTAWLGVLLWLPLSQALAATPAGAVHAHQLQAWQQQFQRLPLVEQQRIRAAWQQYRQLPPEQQQQLQRSFAGLDRLHRDGWRLGPRLGRHWPGLQPLFAYVPAGQQAALLTLLHELDEAALERLVRLAQRTAPEQRQSLREALLALPAAQRASWLRQQAGA